MVEYSGGEVCRAAEARLMLAASTWRTASAAVAPALGAARWRDSPVHSDR